MAEFAGNRRLFLRFAVACTALLSAVGNAASPRPLPALNIDIAETSVSGLSSGAFMAVQFQVAHSSIVKGAGIIAGGPYYCAQDEVITATTRCSCTLDPAHSFCSVTATSTDVAALVAATRRFARDRLIDDPVAIARQRVFTFSGGKDETVPAPVVAQLDEYFAALGLPAASLAEAALAGAGHGMPTESYGGACAATAEPYLNTCGYDAAGKILDWIYGPLQAPRTGKARGRFIRFDQTPFIPRQSVLAGNSGLDSSGWVYVPDSCAKGAKCRLHIALHGCKQGQSYIPLEPLPNGAAEFGTTFVRHAGYDRWADSNRLVVLFPQAVSIPFANPYGCWDWWGYTDEHYADRQGVQIRALRAMADRLAAGVR
jgi:poly(3-hydroxybutyrate) depolymerase